MAEGDHNQIAALKKLDCFEFYARLDVWQDSVKEKIDSLKA
jgi:hypothetical protein